MLGPVGQAGTAGSLDSGSRMPGAGEPHTQACSKQNPGKICGLARDLPALQSLS